VEATVIVATTITTITIPENYFLDFFGAGFMEPEDCMKL